MRLSGVLVLRLRAESGIPLFWIKGLRLKEIRGLFALLELKPIVENFRIDEPFECTETVIQEVSVHCVDRKTVTL